MIKASPYAVHVEKPVTGQFMAMHGLFLESDKCADGVELATSEGQRWFRARTNRRAPVRLEIHNLENPVVVEFINAREEADLLKFFSKFGRLSEWLYGGRRDSNDIFEGNRPTSDWTLGHVTNRQKEFRDWLKSAAGPNQAEALRAMNESLGQSQAIDLTPTFELEAETGNPRMLLKCADLWQFMAMEIAMIAMHGAKLATCEHCGDVFLTGSLTGRRSHAIYCSARCRVAAMRARNAKQAAS